MFFLDMYAVLSVYDFIYYGNTNQDFKGPSVVFFFYHLISALLNQNSN